MPGRRHGLATDKERHPDSRILEQLQGPGRCVPRAQADHSGTEGRDSRMLEKPISGSSSGPWMI